MKILTANKTWMKKLTIKTTAKKKTVTKPIKNNIRVKTKMLVLKRLRLAVELALISFAIQRKYFEKLGRR
jgi:hypothetical protein